MEISNLPQEKEIYFRNDGKQCIRNKNRRSRSGIGQIERDKKIIELYKQNNSSSRLIATVLGVSHMTVIRTIRSYNTNV